MKKVKISKKTNFDISIVDNIANANAILDYIIENIPIVSIDCEASSGMNRYGVLCLLQVTIN